MTYLFIKNFKHYVLLKTILVLSANLPNIL